MVRQHSSCIDFTNVENIVYNNFCNIIHDYKRSVVHICSQVSLQTFQDTSFSFDRWPLDDDDVVSIQYDIKLVLNRTQFSPCYWSNLRTTATDAVPSKEEKNIQCVTQVVQDTIVENWQQTFFRGRLKGYSKSFIWPIFYVPL